MNEEVAEILMMFSYVQHCFKDWADPQKLIQVLVPGLEERARMFMPLSTLSQLSPGEPLPTDRPNCEQGEAVIASRFPEHPRSFAVS